MKKHLSPPLTVFYISLVAAAIFGACSARTISSREAQPPTIAAIAPTVSFYPPESIVFAGETLDLTRYDKRERFDREINSFAYYHSTTLLLIKRANRYFPIIEPILAENGVPDDFKYLCVIESSLDQRALSPSNAAGMWQFLRATGQEFGLEITAEVDERYSVGESTRAACDYLKQAYGKYGSWSAAAMSYNAGQSRITEQMTRQQAQQALDLWLVEETSRYYFRMLAIKEVFENPQVYGFLLRSDQLFKPMKFKKIKVRKSIPNLAEFCNEHGITYADLKEFNLWLRDNKLTIDPANDKTYTILIPTEASLYYNRGERIKVHNPAWVVDR